MKKRNLLRLDAEIIIFLAKDLGRKIDISRLSENIKYHKHIQGIRKQPLSGAENYKEARRMRPLLMELKPIHSLSTDTGLRFDLLLEVRVYPMGSCSFRCRAVPRSKRITVDEVIQITRTLALESRKLLLPDNISLKQYINQLFSEIIKNLYGSVSTDNLSYKSALGLAFRKVAVIINDVRPKLTVSELHKEYSKELAGIVSWRPDWRDFNAKYIEYLVSNPTLTKFKTALILMKFPGVLLFVPEFPEKTIELYLLIVEFSAIQSISLRVYAEMLDAYVERFGKFQNEVISKIKHGDYSRSVSTRIMKELWEMNQIKVRLMESAEDIMRMRDIIPIHRLLLAFDDISKESMVNRQYQFVTSRLQRLDALIKDCYNLFHAEQGLREQEELYYLQVIFVIGVAAQLTTFFFLKTLKLNILGIPLVIASVVLGMTLFYIIRTLFRFHWRKSKHSLDEGLIQDIDGSSPVNILQKKN